jgi:hypothetical protein
VLITGRKTSHNLLFFISAKRYTGRVGDTGRSNENTQGLQHEEMKNKKNGTGCRKEYLGKVNAGDVEETHLLEL